MRQRTPQLARPPAIGTWLATVLVVVGLSLALKWLTLDFEAWTFEDRRRLLASNGHLYSPLISGTDQAGEKAELFNGSGPQKDGVLLVDFVYTRCETVCSALGSVFFQLQGELRSVPPAEQALIGLASVSFDPLDDELSLRKYADRFSANSNVWRVIRVESDEQRLNALRQLGVVAVADGLGGFVHNGSIHVIGSEGRVYGIYEYEQWREALALARSVLTTR